MLWYNKRQRCAGKISSLQQLNGEVFVLRNHRLGRGKDEHKSGREVKSSIDFKQVADAKLRLSLDSLITRSSTCTLVQHGFCGHRGLHPSNFYTPVEGKLWTFIHPISYAEGVECGNRPKLSYIYLSRRSSEVTFHSLICLQDILNAVM